MTGETTSSPASRVDYLVRDLGIALDGARQAKLSLPGLALAEQLYVALQAEGHAQDGVQAPVLALARLSAVEWPAEEVPS
jgi:3-hydroxyisobutyrate dehydrogenase